MENEKVLEELDKRIKRLEAEIELVENRLRYLDEIGAPSKYRAFRRKDYSIYYLLLMGVWMLVGFLALMSIRNRLPGEINIPLLPYLFVALTAIVFPLIYLLWSKREEPKTPMDELEERERLARLVLSLFYRPLRKAIEEGDREALRSLADELLTNPILAEAVERMNEGDPKLMAYALYLYTSYQKGMEGELKEVLSSLHNKPLKALLSALAEA
ncbi:hypothetical membrane protein, conserved [Thermococcus onnurineus NA1]|uniref:Hypothetical membrane protein, conserved n=1 Tax=Thermococcus onnurineus (strain NA1) TaxID=523850 RepID=B6YXJ5_THEON|nr:MULTISPECIES: membrane protein [Thermococcus]ACJ16808.1 hypothetical membrane protein, conserved [Thermococcus onnurineus NA1]NJE46846.1 hypothetical protein [Thermococcus sp. GR7]NJE78343.1 hypothetical protein [Thermococcus sp. GR4]NJF23360.1 hypothetical protein [Thermococcus sp. GR5]